MNDIQYYSHTRPMPMAKFTRLYSIMESSFPPTERGSEELHYAEYRRPEFCCMSYEPGGVPAGFLNYYELKDDDVLFIEHFAVEDSLRGKGTGSEMFRCFLENAGSSLVVLEVEPPEGETEKRRIAFYERLGMTLNNGEYYQPPFYGHLPAILLMLMTNRTLNDEEFAKVKQLIYKKIYRK